MLPNASYFAFTATPKNKTLEIFGDAFPRRQDEAPAVPQLHHEAGHPGGFILDVLQNYTPVESYYRLMKNGRGRPGVRRQEGAEEAAPLRGGPRARHRPESRDHGRSLPRSGDRQEQDRRPGAGDGRHQRHPRAIEYYHAIRSYLEERKSPYRAIVAFSGEHEYGGKKVTEATLNGFPSNQIPGQDSGRPLSLPDRGRQVPDRLRRAAAAHHVRGQDSVRHQGRADAVAPQPRPSAEARYLRARLHERRRHDPGRLRDYYRTTILSEETDPNKLHDLKADLDGYQVYSWPSRSIGLVDLYLAGADRDQLDPILDTCVAVYNAELDEDGQVDFKARPRRSCAPTTSCPRSCPTTTPTGSGWPPSSTS
jgi:type I restriction enzyme, R subunit